jgi:hypothetical protein
MIQRAFLFPGLRGIGYHVGFSVPLRAEMRRTPDLVAEVLLFSSGCLAARHQVNFGHPNFLFYRGWDADWFPETLAKAGDELYCILLKSSSDVGRALPQTDIEAQILFRKKDEWTSSVLSGFVPVRPPGHKFAPIIHTAHYIASEPEVETITLFMNLKDVSNTGTSDAGILNAEIRSRDGEYLATVQYSGKGNATLAVSSDDLLSNIDVSGGHSRKGINVKFWGGASQFSILTVYRNRQNGSIGVEHSLAPLYYLPDLLSPAVRSVVYQQLVLKS